MEVLKFKCLDCNEVSGIISGNAEILKVNVHYLQETLRKHHTPLTVYFNEIGRFFSKHSCHRIAIVNENNELLVRGEFK